MIFLAAAPAAGETTAPVSLLHLADRLLRDGVKTASDIRIQEVSNAMLRSRLVSVPPFIQRITPPERCVAFDLTGLLYLRDVHKLVVLSDGDLNSVLASADLGWRSVEQVLLDLTAALETSDRVLVFDEALRQEVCHFTRTHPALVTAPALPPFRSAPVERGGAIVMFDHLDDARLLRDTVNILKRCEPDRPLVLCASLLEGRDSSRLNVRSFFSAAPQLAYAHIHIGAPVPPRLGNRLVDSFACRRPVVQLIPAFDRIGSVPFDAAGPESIVRDRVNGFMCIDGAGLEVALDLIRSDAAIVEVVLRNADRIVEVNNLKFGAALREFMA